MASDLCEKCGGAGWIWGHELDGGEDPPTDTRYTCDACSSAPASPPERTGEDAWTFWETRFREAERKGAEWMERAEAAERERDEARTVLAGKVAALREYARIAEHNGQEADTQRARALAAESRESALREAVGDPLREAHEQLALYRASMGGVGAPCTHKLTRAIEKVDALRALVAGAETSRTGGDE